jgi:hypothetical protein
LDALQILTFTTGNVFRAIYSLTWWFVPLGCLVAIALILQIRAKSESLGALALGMMSVIAITILIVFPVWVTVITANALADVALLAATSTFVTALCVVVAVADFVRVLLFIDLK